VVTVNGVQSNTGNPAVFDLGTMQGYQVHITIFSNGTTANGTPTFNTFHVTWSHNPSGTARVDAHYHFNELIANNRVAYEERASTPQTTDGWQFRNQADAVTLRNTSVNLAAQLANEINAKFSPTDAC
jgi:hypothetical protein